MNGTALMDEFRKALKAPVSIQELIARETSSDFEPIWRKALLWACASGHLQFVAAFMESSPFQNLIHTARDADQYTPLHRAVSGGHLDIVRMLSRVVYYPFDILHARTNDGWTALHLAVCANNVEMVDTLMKWYEGIDKPHIYGWDFRDNTWMTPLQYAVLGGFHRIVSRLLHSRAFEHGVNALDYSRRSALHMACGHHGSSKIVEEFLSNKTADINAVDCCGFTPLHWAVYVGAAEAVRAFTCRATERTIRTTEEDSEGRPVLQIAVESKRIDHKVGRDIQKLLFTVAEVKDEVERLYRDRQVFVDAANAILVGAALIASVTFGGWLQPPDGPDSEVRIFWACNSLSFFFSVATVLSGAGTVLPMSDVYIGKTVKNIRRWLAFTSFLLLVSVVFVLGAFAAAGFASLPPIRFMQANIVFTSSVGTLLCCTIGLLFLRRLSKISVLEDFQFPRRFLQLQSTRRRGMVEINAALDETFNQVMKTGGEDSETSAGYGGSYHLANVVLSFERAYETHASITGRHTGYKADMVKMKGFEEAFQEVRKGLNEEDGTLNMLTLSQLCEKGLHFWCDISLLHCRQRTLERDTELWRSITYSVLHEKRTKLEEENTRFYYVVRSFDDWNI